MNEHVPPKSFTGAEGVEEAPVLGPITASVGEVSEEEEQDKSWHDVGVEEIDFYGRNFPERIGQRHYPKAYVISLLNSEKKWSKDFYNCMGIAAVGFDPKLKQNISILSHQDPGQVITGEYPNDLAKKPFMKDIAAALREIKERSEPGTLDVVIFGGRYTHLNKNHAAENRAQYEASIPELERIITENTGVGAHVIGANASGGSIEVSLDTKRRRLRVMTPEQPLAPEANTSFPASDFSEELKRWKKDDPAKQ